MYNKVLGYNLLIRPRVQLYLYSGIKYNKMVTLGLSRVDRKSQGSLELVSYLFPNLCVTNTRSHQRGAPVFLFIFITTKQFYMHEKLYFFLLFIVFNLRHQFSRFYQIQP